MRGLGVLSQIHAQRLLEVVDGFLGDLHDQHQRQLIPYKDCTVRQGTADPAPRSCTGTKRCRPQYQSERIAYRRRESPTSIIHIEEHIQPHDEDAEACPTSRGTPESTIEQGRERMYLTRSVRTRTNTDGGDMDGLGDGLADQRRNLQP